MTFDLYPLRFQFEARESIYFPAGKSANVLRGAFGTVFRQIACVPECRDVRSCEIRSQCAYARIFEPAAAGKGPSGLSDWPRPFVFRARHLDNCSIGPGKPFHFDLHVFDLHDPAIPSFVRTFAAIARQGVGPGRGRAELSAVWEIAVDGTVATRIFDGTEFLLKHSPPPLKLSLDPIAGPIRKVRVDFLTPTEVKGGHELAARPDFAILFARIRDRLSTLRALYGPGPLDVDFKAMGERSKLVRMTSCEIRDVGVERRSSRTGQTHPLGGFIGYAEYEGEDLAEFLPYLDAARWTGVGRQTVWGKGEICFSTK
jgi:hypothetical protein